MKILFLVTEDWYFWSHRLALARTLRIGGHQVIVATRVGEYRKQIEAEGFGLIHVDFFRQGGGVIKGIITLLRLASICNRERPDILHNIAIKPALLGSLAARFTRVPLVINTIAGLGHVFISNEKKYRTFRFLLQHSFKLLFRMGNTKTIVQNQDDWRYFLENRIVRSEQLFLIPGSGVDIGAFSSRPPSPSSFPVVVCHSRMLWTKGVGEFIEAAGILKRNGCKVRMVLVGAPDAANPESVPLTFLETLPSNSDVEYWGFREDLDRVLSMAWISVLPSYREGLPKSLMEAAAAGLPLVAFDVPGCREIVRHGENGLLVPFRDVSALATAIDWLLNHPEERVRMGRKSRQLAIDHFDQTNIVTETLKVYFAS